MERIARAAAPCGGLDLLPARASSLGLVSGSLFDRLSRLPLRVVVSTAQQVRRTLWFLTRPDTLGSHAAAVTPRGTIVLVKLRYARGWRLPGGGRERGEDAQAAALRELSEEIGMTAHGAVRLACEIDETHEFRRDLSSLFIVDDVHYAPRWSVEVEAVCEVDPDRLPADTSPRTRRWIDAVRPALRNSPDR